MASTKVASVDISLAGVLVGHNDLVTAIVPGHPVKENEESNVLITASRDRSILVWKLNPLEAEAHPEHHYGQPVQMLKGHSHFITDLALANENNFLLSSSWDKTLRLWDVRSGKSSRLFTGHTKEVLTVAFSPDNRQILSGGSDREIRLWNTLAECKFTFTEKPHTDWVSRVRYSPSQKNPYIASVGWDGFLKIWTTNFQIKFSVKAHDSFINALSIAPNGGYLATGGKDGYVRVWNINNFTTPAREFYVGSTVNSIAFNPKLQWVAVAHDTGFKVYDMLSQDDEPVIANIEITVQSGEAKDDSKRARERKLACNSLAWNGSGMKLFTGFSDKVVRVYQLTTEKKQ